MKKRKIPTPRTTKKSGVAPRVKATAPGSDFFEILWERSWTYIKSVVDVVREPMLILDSEFRVMAANEPFYNTFKVLAPEVEGEMLTELGDGQWKIPVLQKMLSDVLKDHTYFKGFQVAHEFPGIGRKVMILNARQIHVMNEGEPDTFPPIILLAIEDVTELMIVAESLAAHASKIETKLSDRTQRLEIHINRLENQLRKLRDE